MFYKSALTAAALIGLTAMAAASAKPVQTSPEPGVSRALAQDRASRVSNVQYQLQLELRPHADAMPGHETLSFTLTAAGATADLALDFREGSITSVALNGTALAAAETDGNSISPAAEAEAGSTPPAARAAGHIMLPSALLHAGKNTVQISFSSRIALAGAAITRYEDKADGSEYLYSLFVPMDASMAFPCFDQPDLKARFTLSVNAPAAWTVLSNTAAQPKGLSDSNDSRPGSSTSHSDSAGLNAITSFPETLPISTYLFAFTAGPWTRMQAAGAKGSGSQAGSRQDATRVPGRPGSSDVYVRKSQLKRAQPEIPQLQAITSRGIAWLSDYFQQPFPFPKYDMVLIPGFPFGGMEHAGLTFLNENSILFRSAPTAQDRFHRNITVLHELTHQWFGDLVTMRWFDDLWLKEGFAQYMAYRCLEALEPEAQVWKHFYEDIKPQAYGIDETLGATPIFQEIPNLKDAKSAYGAIVYEKAPAILKQLEFWLGATNFRAGLKLYLAQHAYANAQWSDLIGAFHSVSGQDVRSWADAWVLRRGMPEVNVAWSCDAQGRLAELKLTQHDVLPEAYVWPMSEEVLLAPSMERVRVDWSGAEAAVSAAVGRACPSFVFANAGDQAYGRFLLDARSEAAVRQALVSHSSAPAPPLGRRVAANGPAAATPELPARPVELPLDLRLDPLLRSMLWGALWDNVRETRSPPRGYVELVLENLPQESDATLALSQGENAITSLHFYMSAHGRSLLVPQMEQIATERMYRAPATDLRIVNFRLLAAVAETAPARATLKQLLDGTKTIPGVPLRQLDRWNLVGRLVALSDPGAAALLATERDRDRTGDAQKNAWATQAAAPDPAIKQHYFAQYQLPPGAAEAKPEDWLSQSLRPFNNWNQSPLTEPYLRPALEQLAEIKRDRKIFFLGAWLSAFFSGQQSAEAEATVQSWLLQPGIDPDLRLKVLENNHELERTVRIRESFPE